MCNNYTCDLFIKEKNQTTMKQTKIFLSLVIGLQLFVLVFFFNKEKETFKIKIIECRTSQEKKLLYLFTYLFIHCVYRCERDECECVGSMWVYEETIVVGRVGLVADKPQNIYGDEKTTCRNWFSPFTIWDL